jgi:3-mercaptopyruvate sulfurtransferase SseA
VSYVHPEYLISVEELSAQIDDPSLRIFDTSVLLHATDQGYTSEPGRARYLEEHIPGAAFIDLSQDWSDTTSGLNNTLPGIDALAQAIGNDGIGHDHLVVLYSSSHLMWATRAWWLLRYAGHTNVKGAQRQFGRLDRRRFVDSHGRGALPGNRLYAVAAVGLVRKHRRNGSRYA